MKKKEFFKLTPFKMQVIQSFPFIDADFDVLTNYELLCKVVDYLNKTVDNVNLLESDFKTLYDYVHDYFDNLDVQEEINNKLDDMAESGELTDMIAQYLGLAGVLAYNTVADMKTAENLVNGSIAKTLGYHSVNDGGSSQYKIRTITNNDTVDEMLIIALNDPNLVAELITKDIMTPEMLGAYGDGTHDDTIPLQKALSISDANLTKTYGVTSTITVYNNVSGSGKIKALSSLNILVQTNKTQSGQMHNKNIQLNIDCNKLASTGFDVGYSSFCNFDIYVINCPNIGVHNGEITNGNNENKFKIKAVASIDNTLQGEIGVLVDTPDSYFDEIVAVNFKIGCKCNVPTTINVLHPWVFTSNYFADSKALVVDTNIGSININWLYQDNIRYGIYGLNNKTAQININNYTINLTSDYADITTYPPKVLTLGGKSVVKIGIFNKETSSLSIPSVFPIDVSNGSRVFVTKVNNSYEQVYTDGVDKLPTDCEFYCSDVQLSENLTVNDSVRCWSTENYSYQMIVTKNNEGGNVFTPTKIYIRDRAMWSNVWSSWKSTTLS